MYILLGIALFALCGWLPIVFGVSSYAVAFIGGLCGLIIAFLIYLSLKISGIGKNQEEILRRLDEKDTEKKGEN